MLVVVLISLLLGTLYFFGRWGRLRLSLLAAGILHFAFILLSSEILGLLHLFSPHYITSAWIAPPLIWLLLLRGDLLRLSRGIRSYALDRIKGLNGFDAAMAGMLAVLGSLTLLIAARALPNNWDSMTYHLPRILFWLQGHSLSHFPTNDYRMLFNPPLSELSIAHLWILGGQADPVMNLVQWSAYVLLILSTASTAEALGAGQRGQLLSAVAVATLPGIIMQAETTQNDLLTGFFMVTALPFLLRALLSGSTLSWSLGVVSAGLALATKATAFLFLPFVLIVPAVLALKQKRLLAVASLALILLPSSGWLARNQAFFGNPLGYQDESCRREKINFYRNGYFSPAQAVVSIAKNFSLFVATPSERINRLATAAVKKLNTSLGIDPDDPELTWLYNRYQVPLSGPHEDSAPLLWHFLFAILLSAALAWRIRRHATDAPFWFAAVFLLGLLASCVYIKWMPWNARFLILWFVLLFAVAGRHLETWPSRIVNIGVLLFFAAGLPFSIVTVQRSLFDFSLETGSGTRVFFTSVFRHSEAARYMAGKPALAGPLEELVKAVNGRRPGSILLAKRGGDHALYPFMARARAVIGKELRFSSYTEEGTMRKEQGGTPADLLVVLGVSRTAEAMAGRKIFENAFGSIEELADPHAAGPDGRAPVNP